MCPTGWKRTSAAPCSTHRASPVRSSHLVQRPVASAAARSVSDAGEQGYERTEILCVPVVKPARPQGSGAPGNAPATDHHQQHAGRSRLERHGLRSRAGSARTGRAGRSEEHTYELQSLMRIKYAVCCSKKKKLTNRNSTRLNATP